MSEPPPPAQSSDFIPVGQVRMGDLRRLTPVSLNWGYDRGTPVDRHYIESFLEANRADVHGHVLEIGDASYTVRFGGNRVGTSDVLDVQEGTPNATIIADLAHADHLASDRFDCIIFTQTLQYIFDVHAALATLRRILTPDGVLLATLPGTTQIDRDERAESWYWSFTRRSAARLFEETFGAGHVAIKTHGNVLTASAFLYGLAAEELSAEELTFHDPSYVLVIAVRAQKAIASESRATGGAPYGR